MRDKWDLLLDLFDLPLLDNDRGGQDDDIWYGFNPGSDEEDFELRFTSEASKDLDEDVEDTIRLWRCLTNPELFAANEWAEWDQIDELDAIPEPPVRMQKGLRSRKGRYHTNDWDLSDSCDSWKTYRGAQARVRREPDEHGMRKQVPRKSRGRKRYEPTTSYAWWEVLYEDYKDLTGHELDETHINFDDEDVQELSLKVRRGDVVNRACVAYLVECENRRWDDDDEQDDEQDFEDLCDSFDLEEELEVWE